MNDALGVLWFRARQVFRALWFLPAVFSLVALLTVWAAYYAARFAPDKLPFTVESGGVQSILTILGSSMLTVGVFSLSTMVGAVARASENTTPRAVPLILQDSVAQSAISIFVGAFLFSIVGVIGLSSGIYSDAGRLILFGVAMAVVVIVVAALIRWIARITSIGRVDETIGLVESAATKALSGLSEEPLYGCAARTSAPRGLPILAATVGHVQHFDVSQLARLAEHDKVVVHILARPGDFVGVGTPLAMVEGSPDDDLEAAVRNAFGIGRQRTFEYDPAFGLIVLGEIASRALSPAINDPGTAVAVVTAFARIFASAPDGVSRSPEAPEHRLLTIAWPDAKALIETAFRPIARHGAGQMEVVRALVLALDVLAGLPAYAAAAAAMRREVVERARAAMTFEADREAVGRL